MDSSVSYFDTAIGLLRDALETPELSGFCPAHEPTVDSTGRGQHSFVHLADNVRLTGGLCDSDHLHQAADPSRLADLEMERVDRFLANQAQKVLGGATGLIGHHFGIHVKAHLSKPCIVAHRHRLFDKGQAELRQPANIADRLFRSPALVGINR